MGNSSDAFLKMVRRVQELEGDSFNQLSDVLGDSFSETLARQEFTSSVLGKSSPVIKKVMTTCNYCGRKLPDGTDECKSCGAPI